MYVEGNLDVLTNETHLECPKSKALRPLCISVGVKNKSLEYQTELDTMDVGRYQEFTVKI